MAELLNNSQQKAFTTLARAKAFLDISGGSKDTLLTILINQATGAIESSCKRRFLRQTYTNEKYDGTGSASLVLKNFPVTSLTSLQVNNSGDNSDAWETINPLRYFLDGESGVVRFSSRGDGFLDSEAPSFLRAPQKYRATYVAGYLIDFDHENDPALHTLPPAIEAACLQMLSVKLNSRKGGGLQSAKVGDISMTFRQMADADEEISGMLEEFRSVAI